MTTTVAGHTLTKAERRVACEIQDYLKAHGGDMWAAVPNVSPKGDGRWVPLLEIFPRTAKGNADRQTARRLHRLGVLKAWEVALRGDNVKAVPCEHVAAAEAVPVPTKFWSRLFTAAGQPNTPRVQIKADAWRNPVSDERWVEATWREWAGLDTGDRHTFRSAEVVRQVNLGPLLVWADLRDAMLAELGDHPFAARIREADRHGG